MGDYQTWEIQDYSGGINEKVETHLLSKNQCSSAQNYIAPKIGRLQKRAGQAKLNATQVGTGVLGLHGYYYGDTLENRKLIAVFKDGVMYYWDTGTSAFVSTGKTGLNATAHSLFATCVNYLVGMNGVDAPWKYDGTTVSALANAPVGGKCPVLYAEKLFCITDKDTIKWSDSFLLETWPAVNISTDFEKGDGDELVAVHKYSGSLLICKKYSLFKMAGTSLDNFRVTKVEGVHGVAGIRAGIVIEPYFYYISNDGIFRWDGLKAVNIINPPGTDSPGIPDTWAGVNKTYLDKAVASYNKYYEVLEFHVPYGASTTNNLTIVYSLRSGAIWIFSGKTVSCVMDYNTGTAIKEYTGSVTTGYVIEQNTGFNDLGAAISADWQGPNFCGDSPIRIKKFRKAFAEDVKGLNDAVFQYRLNTAATWITPTAATDLNDVRKYMIANGKARFFQPRFTHDVLDQDFALSGFKLHYKPKRDK